MRLGCVCQQVSPIGAALHRHAVRTARLKAQKLRESRPLVCGESAPVPGSATHS